MNGLVEGLLSQDRQVIWSCHLASDAQCSAVSGRILVSVALLSTCGRVGIPAAYDARSLAQLCQSFERKAT